MHAQVMFAAMLAAVVVVAAPPGRAFAADEEVGKKVYAQKCVTCHGADGKGNAKMETTLKIKIPDLATYAAKPEAEWRKFVSEGKKPMPAYGKTLSKDELESVVRYARGLAGAK